LHILPVLSGSRRQKSLACPAGAGRILRPPSIRPDSPLQREAVILSALADKIFIAPIRRAPHRLMVADARVSLWERWLL